MESTYNKQHYINFYNILKESLEINILTLKKELETVTLWHSTLSSAQEKTFSKPIKEGIKDLEFQLKNINNILEYLNKPDRTDTKKYKIKKRSPKKDFKKLFF